MLRFSNDAGVVNIKLMLFEMLWFDSKLPLNKLIPICYYTIHLRGTLNRKSELILDGHLKLHNKAKYSKIAIQNKSTIKFKFLYRLA